MKKYLFILIGLGIVICPHFSFAALYFPTSLGDTSVYLNTAYLGTTPSENTLVVDLGTALQNSGSATGIDIALDHSLVTSFESQCSFGGSMRLEIYGNSDGYATDYSHYTAPVAVDFITSAIMQVSTSGTDYFSAALTNAISNSTRYLLRLGCGTATGYNSFNLTIPATAGSFTLNYPYDSWWSGRFGICIADHGDIDTDCSSTPTPSYASVNFVYPSSTVGTSTAINPFSPWVVDVTNLSTSTQYKVHIAWYMTNHLMTDQQVMSLVGMSFIYQGLPYNQLFADDSPIFYGAVSSTIGIIKADRNLYNHEWIYPASDDTWHALASLVDVTHGGVVSTSSIDFDMRRYGASFNGYGGNFNGTTTKDNITYNPTDNSIVIVTSTSDYAGGSSPLSSSTAFGCVPASSFTDIGGGVSYAFCTTLHLFFDPASIPFTSSFFHDQLALVETDPPFSALFVTANVINSSTANFGNNTSFSNGINIGTEDLQGNPVRIVKLSSTTFYGGFNSSNDSAKSKASMATMEYYITAWLGIGAGVKLLYIFFT